MSTEIEISDPELTIIPMTAGAMLDTGSITDPEALDWSVVLDIYRQYGAVLIGGLKMDRQRFVDLTSRMSDQFMEYLGGADNNRSSAFGNHQTVLTTTGGSVERKAIPLHGEMLYTGQRPATLFFCCMRPADENGQTTICDGVALWQALPRKIQEMFEEQPLVYRRRYDRDACLRVYKTTEPEELSRICAEAGVSLDVLADGGIETTFTTPAYIDGPAGRAFANSLLVWLTSEHKGGRADSLVRMADGSEFSRPVIRRIFRLAAELTEDIPWQAGDLAIVDNLRVMHGRRAYEDPARDIIMRLSLASVSG